MKLKEIKLKLQAQREAEIVGFAKCMTVTYDDAINEMYNRYKQKGE
jgi:hypothetical protein